MLAHLKNKERLCCCQGPVAYAHRQRSIALRAKTEQPLADLRLQNYHFKNQKSKIKNQQSSIDNHQSTIINPTLERTRGLSQVVWGCWGGAPKSGG